MVESDVVCFIEAETKGGVVSITVIEGLVHLFILTKVAVSNEGY